MAKFSAKKCINELQKKADKAIINLFDDAKCREVVSECVSDAMYEVIKENVYDCYSPKVYERRGGDGGLIDKNNIVVDLEGTRVTARNIAEPNESLIGTPIKSENAEGLLYEWMDKGRIGMIGSIENINSFGWRMQRKDLTKKMYKKVKVDKGIPIRKTIQEYLVKKIIAEGGGK